MQNEPQSNNEQQPAIANNEIVQSQNKKLIITVTLAVILTALITSSVTYAWFSFKKNNTNTAAIISVTPTSLPPIVATTPTISVEPILQTSTTQSSDWKTYTNNNFGFSINVPADWTVEEGKFPPTQTPYVSFFSPADAASNAKNILDCTDDNDQTPCAPEGVSNIISFQVTNEITPQDASKIQFNNIFWSRFVPFGSFAGDIQYQTLKSGKQYGFSVSEPHDVLFQEMLKSFHWTK